MKKISLIFSVLFVTMAFIVTPETNPILRYIKGQIYQLTNAKQFENLYLQTDKPLYEQGETVWFSAFVRNATDFKNAESEIVYVELINPKGAIVVKRNLLMENASATGDFQITDDFVGGIYKIKAYTKWMQTVQQEAFIREITVQNVVLPNLLMDLEFQRKAYGKGDKAFADLELKTLKNEPLANTKIKCSILFNGVNHNQFFQTTNENGKAIIQVDLPFDLKTNDGLLNIMIDYEGQTESISRPIPIVLNDIDLQFLPESGNLLDGTLNNVAFKAINEFGKAADVEGAIYNKKGEVITYFSSYHLGMGKFELNAHKNEKYYAKILSPRGIDKKYELPEVDKLNCIVQINDVQPNELNISVIHNLEKTLYVLLENRGEVVYNQEIKPSSLKPTPDDVSPIYLQKDLKIPTENLPIGMSRITIIDESYNALAQRLVFLNQDKQLDISVKTDKELYLPREKVKAEITVKDRNGKPIQGNFMMSVADENLLKLADDKQGHILSQMLLQSDLKGEIEEPNFYFETASANDRIDRQKALDLLMMTQGWRRYEWSKIRNAPAPNPNLKKEKKIIAGKIIDRNNLANKTIITVKEAKISTQVGSDGKFEFRGIDLYEPKTLIIKSSNREYERKVMVNRYQDDLELYLYPIKGMIWDDETGEPIPFANIVIEGQAIGTTTDFDGIFDINYLLQEAAKLNLENPTFRVQYVGYSSKTFSLEDIEKTNAEVFKINMRQNAVLLESVVIGSSKRPVIGRKNKKFKAAKPNKKSRTKTTRNKKTESSKPAEKGKVNIDKFSKISNEKNDRMSAAEITATDVIYYYKPRYFQSPKYKTQKPKTRTDFQTTIYWNGNLQTDENGTANVEFTNVDAITTYRITIEGFGQNGDIGFCQNSLVSSMPFALKLKLPTHLTDGDLIDLPITLVNNSEKKISGKLKIDLPFSLIRLGNLNPKITLQANESQTVFLKCRAVNNGVIGKLKVQFNNGEWNDAIERKIEVKDNGFPIEMSLAGSDEYEKTMDFDVISPIENTANISVKLMPTVLNQVFSDLENMMRSPSGCFEQTSSSNYPNILALNYMREMDKTDAVIEAKALGYLTKGYKRLTSYECKNGGFEWFGADPAHEGLTAYGLMQFVDMQEVFPVSPLLINRTAKWLLSRRNKKGGWEMNENSYHSWAGSPEIFNAYITWAVSEAGHSNKLKKELDKAYNDAVKTEDVYVMALAANALFNANDKRGKELLDDIELRQNEDGSWDGLKHSITHSRGQYLKIETTGLVMLAMIKDKRYGKKITKANDFLMKQRSSYGFGNTQTTVIALKAITELAKNAKQLQKGGKIIVYLDNRKISEKSYTQEDEDEIFINNLVGNLDKGRHTLKVAFEKGKNKAAIPFQVDISYNTTLPPTDKDAPIALSTKLLQTSINQGETVRYQVEIKNNNNQLRNNPIAIVGIPSGTSPQIWQLKKLQKEGIFDYYEIFDGYLVFYYRTLKSKATKTINLDLKAEVKGEFTAPASTAYLYYNADRKTWVKAEKLKIL